MGYGERSPFCFGKTRLFLFILGENNGILKRTMKLGEREL